jgi:hypothetical protein
MTKAKLFLLVTMLAFSGILISQDNQIKMPVNLPWGPAPQIDNPLSPFVEAPLDAAPNSRAFAFDAFGGTTGPSKFFLNTPTTITNISSQTAFFAGGTWAPLGGTGTNYKWFYLTYSPVALGYCDTATGVNTPVGNPVLSGSPVGLAWDQVAHILYCATASPSNLYTINITTGAATLVAPYTGVQYVIDIACSPNGTLWGVELAGSPQSRLVKINKTTGACTIVGSGLGISAFYAQGSSFDELGVYYWCSFTQTNISQLRTIDTTLGTSTVIGTLGSNYEMDGMAIPAAVITPPPPPPCPTYYASIWCSAGTYANIPAASLYNACAWLGDTLYMHSPDGTGTPTTLIQRYSITGNSWSTGVPLPAPKTQGTLTRCGTKLYFIGGGAAAGDGGSNTVYEYSAGAWTTMTPLPGNVSGHAAVNWGDSVIITVCGPWSTPTTNCYYFRPGTNTSGTSTPFGGAARRSHAFGISGNKIFIACGFPFQNDLWIGTIGSNASTITWAPGPTPPGVPRSRIGGVGVCDKFYIIGGNNSAGATSSDSTSVYNVNGNTWTVIPGKPAPVHNNEAAVTYKLVGDTSKIFCPGGSSLAATTLNNDVIGCGGNVLGITQNGIPRVYSLGQNYPNPFNPTTTIKFEIPKSGLVKLVVFDILGREVTTLVNDFKQAGNYNISFDASSLASGVYFYKIEANDFVQTKKMLLIK